MNGSCRPRITRGIEIFIHRMNCNAEWDCPSLPHEWHCWTLLNDAVTPMPSMSCANQQPGLNAFVNTQTATEIMRAIMIEKPEGSSCSFTCQVIKIPVRP